MKKKIKKLHNHIKSKIKKRHIIFFIILLVISLLLSVYKTQNEIKEKIVRESAVAGTWYPSSKDNLNEAIDIFLNKAKTLEIDGKIKALIVPHAGYAYSGLIAAYGFKQLKESYETIIVLGTPHHYPLQGVSIADVTHYKTPLGEIKLSEKVKQLKKEKIINSIQAVHEKEHSIEIELPFLQKILGQFELIPIVVGNVNPEELAEILIKYIDDKTLIVVSSDFSHYHPYEEAVALDTTCINFIHKIDIDNAASCEACGLMPILTLMHIAKKLNWQNDVVIYANSGDITNDKTRVVGYSSIIFYEKNNELTEKEKEFLLKIARQKLESIYTKEEINIDTSELTPNLKKIQGCFTTLTKNKNLRGCIGYILPQEELYKCVMDNIVNAALHDIRFMPVTQDELKDIEIEISVLSVPKKIEFSSPEDLLSKLRPLVDGIVLKSGPYQSTYLPQVWEMFPDKESFLSSLCEKAGLVQDCWKKDIEVYTYQADVFPESE